MGLLHPSEDRSNDPPKSFDGFYEKTVNETLG